MTRVKKGSVTITERPAIYQEIMVNCPHCKGQFGPVVDGILRLLCFNCKKPVEIAWDKVSTVRRGLKG